MNKEAVSRYAAGKGYIEAAKMIFMSPLRSSDAEIVWTVLPLNLLGGFALELLFKAWLLDSGQSTEVVRAFGHRIDDLFVEAQAKSLPDIENLDQLVAGLAKGHKDLTHRYINSGDDIFVVEWEKALPIIGQLDTVIGEKLASSAKMAMSPSAPDGAAP